MKIGIYTDAHFCKSSSILVGASGSRYPLRLDCLVKSFKWMYDLFNSNQVTTIFNLGDLLSSHNLDVETNTALEEALSQSYGVHEYWLIGNHEMKSDDSTFNSLAVLKQSSNVTIIQEPQIFEITDGDSTVNIFASPFVNDNSIIENNCLKLESQTIVLTHQVYTKIVPQLSSGVDLDLMLGIPAIKQIFNGHIHSALDRSHYCQVGSLMGGSFGDSYMQALPGVIIYDTESGEISRYANPFATLYFTIEISDSNQILTELSKLPEANSKFIRFRIPLSAIEVFNEKLSEISDELLKLNVVAKRIVTEASNSAVNDTVIPTNFNQNSSIIDSLRAFTMLPDTSTPYEKSEMLQFIDTYLKDGDSE